MSHATTITPRLAHHASLVSTVVCLMTCAACSGQRSEPTAATPPPAVAPANTAAPAAAQPTRIVAIGGGVVETLVELGLAEQIVAYDSSGEGLVPGGSPTNLGSPHRLAAESVLAQRPDLVIAAAAGPRNDMLAGQVASAGVRFEQYADVESVEDIATRISALGALFGREEQATALVQHFRDELARAALAASQTADSPSALFLYARGHGTLFVAGSATRAHDVLLRAGATNAAASLDGFQPLTPEALVAGQPMWLVVPQKGLESLGGVDGLLAVPGVAETPAGRYGNFIVMEDHRLLGGGPSLGGAIVELAERLATQPPSVPGAAAP